MAKKAEFKDYLQTQAFPGFNVALGAGQDQYSTIYAYRDRNDPEGSITLRWKLTFRQRLKVLFKGNIWHEVLTFGTRFQPVRMSVEKPIGVPDNEVNAS